MMEENRRILLIDDTPAIHDDFRRILMPTPPQRRSELESLEEALFDEEVRALPVAFELVCALQGAEGVARVREHLDADLPFAMAFVDMRMPPGYNGIETVERLWQLDPRLQVVICTAYSDYSWGELLQRLDVGDRLLLLKKPFDAMEVYQLATALTAKWRLSRQAELKVVTLEEGVAARTAELAAANEALRARTEELAAANDALRERSRDLAAVNEALRVDIGRRRMAEEEARNAHRRVAEILEFLPDPTFVVDKERRVIAWNRALEELTGVPKEEMLGQGDLAYSVPFYGLPRLLLIDLLEEESVGRDICYDGVQQKGETLCFEATLVLCGKERLVWSAAAPLYDLHGNRVGGIQTLRDITDVRRSEQERSKLESRLEHSNILQSLIVQLNHELRTPVTPLFVLLPIVKEKTEDPALKRMLEVCEKSAEQILGLTSKSTEWVRLATEPLAVLAPVLLAKVAQECLRKNAGLFTQLGVKCNCSEIDTGLAVLGAPDQLALLFDNLLSNAARYARQGGTVSIWALCAAGMVTVAVQDDGVGLLPEARERIFDDVDVVRKDASQGLALCKRIVLNHRGSIWAESPGPGEGTTIYFTLKEARQG